MNALFYLHKRILINGFKRSIRKPAFVLMLIAAIAYFVLLAAGYKIQPKIQKTIMKIDETKILLRPLNNKISFG